MSSTNKTATIELSQYIGTDKPTYLSDYNGDMLKIDTAIADDRDSIATAQAKADGADGKADANASAISTLDTQINGATTGLAARVTDVEGDVNTIESLIGNGQPTTEDKTIIGAINEIYAEIGGGSSVTADVVSYDNTDSGLTADNVQAAIDEVYAAIPQGGSVDADDVSYDNTQSGLTASNVQSAIDELATAPTKTWTKLDTVTHTASSAGSTPKVITADLTQYSELMVRVLRGTDAHASTVGFANDTGIACYETTTTSSGSVGSCSGATFIPTTKTLTAVILYTGASITVVAEIYGR